MNEVGVVPQPRTDAFVKANPESLEESGTREVSNAPESQMDPQEQAKQGAPRLGVILNLIEKAKEKNSRGRRNNRAVETYLIVSGKWEHPESSKGKQVNQMA